MFKIDKDVPIPKKRGGPGAQPKYPWHQMEVGDSFFAAAPLKAVLNAAGNWAHRHGVKFSGRAVTEDGVKGARVWRIE